MEKDEEFRGYAPRRRVGEQGGKRRRRREIKYRRKTVKKVGGRWMREEEGRLNEKERVRWG